MMGFAKVGLYGLSGSGKTTTAMKIATGLSLQNDEPHPIYFLDTETGSDWFIKRMGEAGIPFFQAKTRAFMDLSKAMKEAEDNDGILIIDSLSHFWTELKDSYKRKKGKKYIRFQDWADIKGVWRQHYVEPFTNSSVHIIVCGRVQDIYETLQEGTIEIIKIDERMKAEKDFSYEPSLVVKMESITATQEKLEEAKTKKARKGIQVDSDMLIRAEVRKDRADQINGQVFTFPTFDDFAPHFNELNIGGEHLGVDTEHTSDAMFNRNSEVAAELYRKRDIALDEFEAELKRAYPGRDTDSKNIKSDILKGFFGTRAWTAVQEKDLDIVECALSVISKIVDAINEDPEINVEEEAKVIFQEAYSKDDDQPFDLPDDLKAKYEAMEGKDE